MPTQINSKHTPKTYDSGDMNWAHEVAESDMRWMIAAINHLKKEIKGLHTLAEGGKSINKHHFSDLFTHLEMYEHIANDRHDYHEAQAKTYDEELEANKKAVSL